MKVFRVSNEEYNYCDDMYCIVVAESEEAIRSKIVGDDNRLILSINDMVFSNWHQGKITIEEIDLSKEAILCVKYL